MSIGLALISPSVDSEFGKGPCLLLIIQFLVNGPKTDVQTEKRCLSWHQVLLTLRILLKR